MNSSSMHFNFDPQKTEAAREREHRLLVLSHMKTSEKFTNTYLYVAQESFAMRSPIAEVYWTMSRQVSIIIIRAVARWPPANAIEEIPPPSMRRKSG